MPKLKESERVKTLRIAAEKIKYYMAAKRISRELIMKAADMNDVRTWRKRMKNPETFTLNELSCISMCVGVKLKDLFDSENL